MVEPRPKRRLSRWVNGNMAELLLGLVVVMLSLVAYLDAHTWMLARRVADVEAESKSSAAAIVRIEKTTDMILSTLLNGQGDSDE